MRHSTASAQVVRHKRRGWRPSLAPILITAMVLSVVAGGVAIYNPGASGGGVELTVFWWGGAKRAELTEKALDLYESRHPEVRLKTLWQGNSGYFETLSTQAASGTAPDIFQIDDNYLSEYVERKLTLDLTPYVRSGDLDLSKLPASLAEYGQIDEAQVAAPAAENTACMVYDRTLLRSLKLPEPTIGMSYEQLFDWAEKVKEESGGEVFGTMDASADYKALWMWLRGQGKDLYAGRQLGFTQQDLTRWFELWREASDRQLTPPADLVHQANAQGVTKQLVVTGKSATSFLWSNQLPELAKNTKHELGAVSYPGKPSAQWARASMYWSVFRGSDNAAVAVDVIDFLTNDEEAGKILGTERGLPANTQVREAVQATLDDPAMKASVAFEDAMAERFGSAPDPPPRGHAKIRSLLTTAAETVQYGRASPADAAAQFVRQAASALEG